MDLKPFLQAVWLADDVTSDPATGKVTVSGIFDEVEVERPGAKFTATAYLFFVLRGVHGEVKLTLCYVDLSDNAVLLEWPLTVGQDDPLRSTDVALKLPPIPIPHEGEYAWELLWNGEMIGVSRVTARVKRADEHQD